MLILCRRRRHYIRQFFTRGAGERGVVGAQPLGGGVRVAPPRAQNVHAVQPGRGRGRGLVVRAFVVRASVRALIDRVSTHGRRRGLMRFGRAPLTPAERLAENARQRIRRGRLGAPRLRVVLVRLGSSPRRVRERQPRPQQERLRLERVAAHARDCLLYTSPSPRDATLSRMPSSA